MQPDPASWWVGAPGPAGAADAGHLALTTAELPEPAGQPDRVLGFHQAMADPPPPAADRVTIALPVYRGKSFVPVLAWLVATRLAAPDAEVTWQLDKQQGPDSIQRLLSSLGWQLTQTRHGSRARWLTGSPPVADRDKPPELPEPRSFRTTIGAPELTLEADFGVFSPTEIDAGTRLLLDVALRGPEVATLADIGTGYGPLAIGLLRNGIAQRAVATDVDCIALWLAQRNAAASGHSPVQAVWSADPGAAEPTDLTVCNVPTHINAEQTAALLAGLLRRARDGRLLAVVHASLEARYTRYFTTAGFRPVRHPGPQHVVLDTAR